MNERGALLLIPIAPWRSEQITRSFTGPQITDTELNVRPLFRACPDQLAASCLRDDVDHIYFFDRRSRRRLRGADAGQYLGDGGFDALFSEARPVLL
jgi:hypothetical protein